MTTLIGVQFDMAWEDKPANFARVRELLARDRPAAGALVVLPEMFSTGFSMNVAGIREGADRPAERFLADVAREYGAYTLGGVVNEGPGGVGRNQALAYGPGGAEVCRYDKIHPFTFGEESRHYAGGADVAVFDWEGTRVAPLVCYDLRFPEAFRLGVRHGAEVFVVIANWPAAREGHWVTLLRARAIENQAYVIGVNRTGRDPLQAYAGRSMVIDPQGEVVADARGDEGTVRADIDLPALRRWRQAFPALRDVRLI